jgi:tetratricopeptide (TPR) repeat protein
LSGAALRCAGLALVVASVAAAVKAGQPIRTLDGRSVEAPAPTPEFVHAQEALLAEATAARAAARDNPDPWVWVGRRQAYLGRWSEALATYGEGLELFPQDARFLRHRGHRYITLRRLDDAVADLSRAADMIAGRPDEVEPDGLPNAAGIPTSTLGTNIWYHLGLAHYLRGDFAAAAVAYGRCRDLAANPDMLVAASYWLYLSERRAGEAARAAATLASIGPDLELIENEGYYQLLRTYAGGGEGAELLAAVAADPSAVAYPTTAYGLAVWHLLNGRRQRAREILLEIIAAPMVTAFGYIAAEAELTRGF